MQFVQAIASDLKKAFSKGVFHLFLASIFTQGAAFIIQFIVARLLGPAAFGYVKVIDTVLGISFILAGFGMPSAVAKFVSEVKGEPEKGKVFFQCAIVGIATSALAAFILFNTVRYIAISQTALHYLRFLIWSIMFTVLSRSITSYYQGKKEIQKMAKLNVLLGVTMVTLVSSLTYLLALNGWALGRFFSEALFAGALLLLVRKRFIVAWDWRFFKRVLKFGGFAALSLGVAKIVTTADVLYLDHILKDAQQVGCYGVASLTANALMLLPGAIGATALPYISERSLEFEKAYSLGWVVVKKTALLMLPLIMVIFLFSPILMTGVLGDKYATAGILLQILVPGIFAGALLTIAGTFLLSIGRTDLTFYGNLVGLGFNIGLNLILIPKFGAIGAAWTATATYVLRLLIYFSIIKYFGRYIASTSAAGRGVR